MSKRLHRISSLEIGARLSRAAILLPLLVLLAGCGDYAGGAVPQAQPFSPGSTPSGLSEAEQIQAFTATLWPLLTSETCGGCHTSVNGRTPFLLADSNATVAFRAIVDNGKVNFDTPSSSRLVARLAADQHHCWSPDCQADATEMLLAIEAWVADIEARGGNSSGGTAVAGGTLRSTVVASTDGVEDEGGARYTGNLIALWKFDEKTGNVANDTSGVPPAMNVTLGTDVSFMQSYGIELANGTATATTAASRKLYDHIAHPDLGTGQYSIEMWVVPADTNTQADMLRHSNDVMLRQRLYQYDYRNRSLAAGLPAGGGSAQLLTYSNDRDLQAGLQHSVVTFDYFNGMKIYVNGEWTDDVDEFGGGYLWNWSQNSRLTLGDFESDGSGWFGQIRMLAIYKQALNEGQISQNYLAGVGLRLTLGFDISSWAGAGSRVEMSLSQLDDQSYLLCQPTVVTATPGLRVRGIRVIVNGQVAPVGQAFTQVNTVVNGGSQQVHRGCTMVENPPGADTFQLAFEGLAGWVDPVTPASWPPISYDYSGVQPLPSNGVRDFARINETMASLTGIDASDPGAEAVYLGLRQQLPGGYDVRSFVASNQVGIAKLGLEYCGALVDDASARADFFDTLPGFEWTATPALAFLDDGITDKRLRITTPLLEKMVGVGLGVQPDLGQAETRLLTLIDELVADCGVCDAVSTRSIVKGACTAVIASGATTIH